MEMLFKSTNKITQTRFLCLHKVWLMPPQPIEDLGWPETVTEKDGWKTEPVT